MSNYPIMAIWQLSKFVASMLLQARRQRNDKPNRQKGPWDHRYQRQEHFYGEMQSAAPFLRELKVFHEIFQGHIKIKYTNPNELLPQYEMKASVWPSHTISQAPLIRFWFILPLCFLHFFFLKTALIEPLQVTSRWHICYCLAKRKTASFVGDNTFTIAMLFLMDQWALMQFCTAREQIFFFELRLSATYNTAQLFFDIVLCFKSPKSDKTFDSWLNFQQKWLSREAEK